MLSPYSVGIFFWAAAFLLVQKSSADTDTDTGGAFKCTGYSTSLPYILEAYLVIDGSDKQHGAAYQTLLNELFTKITKDYPGSKLGLGSYIDKPFENQSDYCYQNHLSLSGDRREVGSAVSRVRWGPGGQLHKSSLDAIFYSAKRSATGWSTGKMSAEGRPIFRCIIMSTSSDYRKAGQGAQHGARKPNLGKEEYDCKNEDYVSLEQATSILKSKDIHPVVIATESAVKPFEQLIESAGVKGLVVKNDNTNLSDLTLSSLRQIICKIQDEIFLYACIICIQNRFSSRTSMPEKPTKEDVEKPAMLDVVKGVTDNLKEYATRVTKVQSVNEWMELNQQLLDSPFAGLDRFATGAVFGVCSGLAARRAFQFAAVITGFGFISLQFLNYYGYVNVDWKRLQTQMESSLDLNKDGKLDRQDLEIARKKLMQVLTWGVPCAGGFGTGFLIGFKGKF